MHNIILLADSYKTSHYKQYPPKTEYLYCYLAARHDECMFFGLQYIVKKYLVGQVITKEKIQEAKEVIDKHMGCGIFNEEGWNHILENHGGHLPIKIYAVPEGLTYQKNEPLIWVINTDPNCAWLVTYLETLLLQVWYPCTVATNSSNYKRTIKIELERTSDSLDSLDYQLHDFGFRGVSSCESAAIAGAAHLINFKGTDNMAALTLIRDYYNSDICAYSIPAAEHSTICSWGEEGELAAYTHILNSFPDHPISIVSDSYNIYNACSKFYGNLLYSHIVNRRFPLIIRPDSGYPETQLPILFDIIWKNHGGTINKKGFKVLNNVKFIWGDGLKGEKEIRSCISICRQEGYSAENLVLGIGGGLLQNVERDNFGFVYKCAISTIDERNYEIYKNPIDDDTKMSLRLSEEQVAESMSNTPLIFLNGTLKVSFTFEQIRRSSE